MGDFEAIYLEYFDSVYRYVFSLCRDEGVAEEITQEAFFRAMEHMERFDGRCKLYVWLCQIAKNTYFSYTRKRKRWMPEEDAGEFPGEEQGLEENLVDRETAWEIHKRVHGLSEPYREVFLLRVFGELPFSRIGELFGRTDSWARLIFYRAKMKVRRGLDENVL